MLDAPSSNILSGLGSRSRTNANYQNGTTAVSRRQLAAFVKLDTVTKSMRSEDTGDSARDPVLV